jgi:hypothetical protein
MAHRLVWVVGFTIVAATTSCGAEDGQAAGDEPCSAGLCTTGGDPAGPSGSGGPGSGGGPAGSSGAGADGCAEAWLCTPWDTQGNGDDATRTCVDTNGCGTSAAKPVESATLPALDLDYYKCNVEPILDQKCSQLACHGTEEGRALRTYARGRLRNATETVTETGCLSAGEQKSLSQCVGGIECICWSGPHTPTEWQRNYDAARGFALDASGNAIPPGMEDSSELIAQPIVGGKAHAGIHLFRSGDPDHTTLAAWLGGAALGQSCNTTN